MMSRVLAETAHDIVAHATAVRVVVTRYTASKT